MYESISDADVTATTTFLSGPEPPLTPLQRYRAEAAADLARLKSAADANQPLTAALAAFSAGLPVYTGYVAQAQTEYALGYPLTGGSFMQVASEEAHVVLLPAARTIYALQDAALTAASSQATGVPLVIVAGVWLVVTFAVARSDLVRGIGHGSSPAGTLAQASIDVQQVRGDEILNL